MPNLDALIKKKDIDLDQFIDCYIRVVPLVIPITPALEPIINIQKSGACPVIPNMVVLRYFS